MADRLEKPDLLGMVDQLEGLLHEELPEAANQVCATAAGDKPGDGVLKGLAEVVGKVEDLQRKIGMATFEMIRRGEAPPLIGRARFRDTNNLAEPADAPYDDPMATMRGGVAPVEATDGPEPPTPRCTGCKVFSVGSCESCGKPFCARDIHPSMHPCGDL